LAASSACWLFSGRRIAGSIPLDKHGRLVACSQHRPLFGVDLEQLKLLAQDYIANYTALEPKEPLPAAEYVDRRQWAQINLATFQGILDPVTERIEQRFSFAGPLAGPLRIGAGTVLAAEVGLVVGYLSQHVLGQYELSLLQPQEWSQPPRLLFVTPNLEQAIEQMQLERESFLTWIVLHECTHAFQFAGVPWLRQYMSELLNEYLESVDVRIDDRASGRLALSLPNPSKLVEDFREGGLAALVANQAQRDIMSRIQSVMAVIEGYSEHVMDVIAADMSFDLEHMRDALASRRRNRPTPERILRTLLGFDMKMRQYELGKYFCDRVAQESGISWLNKVWQEPKALPSLDELQEPEAWITRVQGDYSLRSGTQADSDA
jgi:coenzyme F420 biosynthesis associated uncharacterized protein